MRFSLSISLPFWNIIIHDSVAEVGSLSARAKMATKVFVKRVFAIFATNASFFANSIQTKTLVLGISWNSLEQSFHQAKRVQLMSNACAMNGSCPEWMGFALSVPRLTVQTAEQLNQIAVVGGKVTTTWLLWVGRHQKTWLSMVGYLFFIQSWPST